MSTAAKEKKNVAKGFQPLGDRVFVTYTEELERTSGGIYVPDSAKEKPQRGIVQAVIGSSRWINHSERIKTAASLIFCRLSRSRRTRYWLAINCGRSFEKSWANSSKPSMSAMRTSFATVSCLRHPSRSTTWAPNMALPRSAPASWRPGLSSGCGTT